MENKIALGQFYTTGNPFTLDPFVSWSSDIKIRKHRILEPFAGANNIIKTLSDMGLCKSYKSYDIEPSSPDVAVRDTIKSFPANYSLCVTNPPWLAKNSAARKNIRLPNAKYDDLYKCCLELCLDNCDYVAALLPATYLQSNLFRERLHTYILLHNNVFMDTDNPVCLALFDSKATQKTRVFYDNDFIGYVHELEQYMPQPAKDRNVRFNDPEGTLGFISFDNTRQPSIRFCKAGDISKESIKHSSRFITRISGDFGNIPRLMGKLNRELLAFRRNTKDLFLTPFKGIRKDGCYRRRMEYVLARKMINSA